MGVINHNAIIATTGLPEFITKFDKWIAELLPAEAALIVKTDRRINGYVTYLIGPDGSKEGWNDSDIGNEFRAKVIARLTADGFEDESSPWDWVEVGYGEFGASIDSTNCKNRY